MQRDRDMFWKTLGKIASIMENSSRLSHLTQTLYGIATLQMVRLHHTLCRHNSKRWLMVGSV
jgi:hypothetical protein